jgi:hypothetical protein
MLASLLIAHEKLLKIQQTFYTTSWNHTTEGFVTGFVKLMTAEYDTMVPAAQSISIADIILHHSQSEEKVHMYHSRYDDHLGREQH